MSEALDAQRLAELVHRLADELDGEWLLVGGALVALWLEPRRTTEDVDLIGMCGTPGERLALMNAASRLGLPIEVVNSAADFFVQRVPGWRREVEPFVRGARAVIYRPTPTLFLLLKVQRLSEQDLADCLALLSHAEAEGLPVDHGRVNAALHALGDTTDPALARRREDLRRAAQPR